MVKYEAKLYVSMYLYIVTQLANLQTQTVCMLAFAPPESSNPHCFQVVT